ncbi:MAG: DMT family transporter [Ilumatobacteraceae bacterium]|nr:DMT family transporter [Ilumatobacteraceae bacterium]
MTSVLVRARTAGSGGDDLPVLAAVIAVLAWGAGPLMARAVSVPTPTLVFYRLAIGVPLMLLIAHKTGGKFSVALIKKTSFPGILFGLSMLTGFASVKLTSIANATLITTLQPALVLLVAPRLFGEQWRAIRLSLATVAFGGVSIVVLAAASTSGASSKGDLLAGVNVVIWTTYFLMAKHLRNSGIHSWTLLACVFSWGSVVVVPWALLSHSDLGAMNTKDWVLVSLMSLIPGILGHGLMTWAQKHIDVTLASLLGLASPVISTIGAWIIFDQILRPLQIVGAGIVLGALAALLRSYRGSIVLEQDAITPSVDPLLS